MKKETLLGQLPFRGCWVKKAGCVLTSAPLISITSPLLLGLDKQTASTTPLTEVSIASSSRASVMLVSVIHTHDPWKQVRQEPFAIIKSFPFLFQSKCDTKQVCSGYFPLFLPLSPEKMFLLLMLNRYIKSSSVFKAAQSFRDVFGPLICFGLSSVCTLFL